MSVTINGTNGLTFADASTQGTGGYTGFRNRIINGAMMIDQRNAGASVTPTTNGTYNLDRWRNSLTQASKFSVQQNAGSVTPPTGFTNYLGVTSTSAYSVLAGDIFGQMQMVEGYNIADFAWGTASASAVTLSFKVYSSLTGTFGGSISNNANDRFYVFSYSIPVANAWTTISVTIPGATSGTWLTNNGIGAAIHFGIGVGSTYSGTAGSWGTTAYYSATGATSVVGTSGATFYITGVQLEKGSVATPFEVRQYGEELMLCQRYYELVGQGSVASSTTNTSAEALVCKFQVAKRATPSITHLGNYTLLIAGQASFTATSTTLYTSSASGFLANVSVSTTPSATGLCMVYTTASDNISASAEL